MNKEKMIYEISKHLNAGCVFYCLEKLNKLELELLHNSILNNTIPKY